MNDTQMIRKRLSELKRLSIELKEKTNDTSIMDYNIVRDILYATKSIDAHNNHSGSLTHTQSNGNTYSLGMKDSADLPTFPMYSSNNHHEQEQNFPPLFPSKSRAQYTSVRNLNKNIDNNNAQQSCLRDTNQQVRFLQQQNAELQSALAALQVQLQTLSMTNKRLHEEKWKEGIPYFTLEQELNVFPTKLNVPEKDYDKIDYAICRVKLDFDKVILLKRGRKDVGREFLLEDLRDVFYVGNNTMVLHFKDVRSNVQVDERVFFMFGSNQEQHRWDLGFFVNFKIVESLQKDRLFDGDVEFDYQKASKSDYKAQSRSDYKAGGKSERSRQKLSRKSSIKNSEDSDLKPPQMKRKISDENSNNFSNGNKKSQTSQKLESPNILEEESKNQKPEQLKRLVDEHSAQQLQYLSQDQLRAKPNPQADKGSKNYQYMGTDHIPDSNQKTQRENTSKFHPLNEPRFQHKPQSQQPKSQLKHPPTLIQKTVSLDYQSSNSKKEEQELLERYKEDMKRGYNMTKYAEGGWNPHEKRVYLNITEDALCFQDIQRPGDVKVVKFSMIVGVEGGKIGKGVKKHVSKPIQSQYMMIELEDNKVIQLGYKNKLLMAQFIQRLSSVVKDYERKYLRPK